MTTEGGFAGDDAHLSMSCVCGQSADRISSLSIFRDTIQQGFDESSRRPSYNLPAPNDLIYNSKKERRS